MPGAEHLLLWSVPVSLRKLPTLVTTYSYYLSEASLFSMWLVSQAYGPLNANLTVAHKANT